MPFSVFILVSMLLWSSSSGRPVYVYDVADAQLPDAIANSRIFSGKEIENQGLFDDVVKIKHWQWLWEIIWGLYAVAALLHIMYMIYDMKEGDVAEEKKGRGKESRCSTHGRLVTTNARERRRTGSISIV